MKKYVAVILIALLALCGCSSDNPSPAQGEVMDFHVPNEFRGAWRCDTAELPDGSTGTEIIEITADDIGGLRTPFNQMLENYMQLAEKLNVPFDTKFTESHPAEGYYTFNLYVFVGYDTVSVTGNLQLTDTGTLKVILSGSGSDSDNFYESSEYYSI